LLGNALGLGDLHGQLSDGAEHADQIEVLEGVLLRVLEGDASHDHHQRRVGHIGGGHPRQKIRGAGAARDQASARRSGYARQPVGHEGGRLFMTNVDVLHASIVIEPVKHIQEGGAHDAEDVAHALGLQQLDHGSSACPLTHTDPPSGESGRS
jgi:hypothetical protein